MTRDLRLEKTVRWLMMGDPAIRWQVMRDLQDVPESRWRKERQRVAREGWGARILAEQDDEGRWTKRLYGQKWISTTYSMVLLRQMGLPPDDPRARKSCLFFLQEGLGSDGGIDICPSLNRSEECITGFVLGLLSWFHVGDEQRDGIAAFLLREQMKDGGWNCQRYRGATHSSFHTTVNVLEGLRDYVEAGGRHAKEVLEAEQRGREFFLVHHLYRSHRTGAVANPAFMRFSFPPRWHHDVLRTLDYFRASGSRYDERLEDPVGVLLRKMQGDGSWLLQNRHPGKVFFEMEQCGRKSRWNTLRGLRVLRWWDVVSRTYTSGRSAHSPQAPPS